MDPVHPGEILMEEFLKPLERLRAEFPDARDVGSVA
jgi:plasmid maintenance system antidote protein VapI